MEISLRSLKIGMVIDKKLPSSLCLEDRMKQNSVKFDQISCWISKNEFKFLDKI